MAGQLRPDLVHGDVHGPVRADQQGQLGQQLGQVEAPLELGGRDVAVAGVEQDDVGALRAGQQDAVGGQRPVRDPVLVQPQHGGPDAGQLVIGGRGGQPGQGGAGAPLAAQHRRLGADPDQGAQLGGRHPGVLHRVDQQGLALDGALHGQRGAARDLGPEPDRR